MISFVDTAASIENDVCFTDSGEFRTFSGQSSPVHSLPAIVFSECSFSLCFFLSKDLRHISQLHTSDRKILWKFSIGIFVSQSIYADLTRVLSAVFEPSVFNWGSLDSEILFLLSFRPLGWLKKKLTQF